LLRDTIVSVVDDGVSVVDSAGTTAIAVREVLQGAAGMNANNGPGELRLMATDGATRFARVGGQFLGQTLAVTDIEIVDL
jgi:glutamate racemase